MGSKETNEGESTLEAPTVHGSDGLLTADLLESSGKSNTDNPVLNRKRDDKCETDEKPLFNILQKLGESQQRAMENFYQSAVEAPCRSWTKCQEMSDFSYVNCEFLSGSRARQYQNEPCHQDPFNRSTVGPRSCEYCGSHTTLDCSAGTCERPPLFFKKMRSPFQEADPSKWDLRTDYRLQSEKQSEETHSSTINKQNGLDSTEIVPMGAFLRFWN